MTNQWDPSSIFEVFSDQKARQILVATDVSRRSAQELREICDGSQSAIYRRINVMHEFGLLAEHTRIDTDGHHCNVYATCFEDVSIRLDHDQIVVNADGYQYTEQWPQVTV